MTKKQLRRLNKNRESQLSCVREAATLERAAAESGKPESGFGSVRPSHKPHWPCRDMRPKSGYFTRGVKSGPVHKIV
jgi:hypothetical protein